MTARWQIFRISNFVQLAGALIVFLFAFIAFLKSPQKEFLAPSIIMCTVMAITILNCIFNLHLLQRFYPQTPLSKNKRKIATVLLVLYILSTLGVIVVFVYSVVPDIPPGQKTWGWIIFLWLYAIYMILCVVTIIPAATLPSHIERNSRIAMFQLTEEIGEDKPEMR